MASASPPVLSHEQRRRYARHLVLPQFGELKQQQLQHASVLVIGAGGLGSAVLSYLCAAGVGTLGVADADTVELSNLNRQILHETGDIGRPKAQSAEDRLSELNPDICVNTHILRVDALNAANLIEPYDVVVDGTDNFDTRFIINEACLHLKKPWIYAAVRGWQAQMSSFRPDLNQRPCYRCLVPESPPFRQSCEEGGVIGPLVGIVGSMQALEVIRILTGVGQTWKGRLLRYDGLNGQWHEAALLPDNTCITCTSYQTSFS